MTPDREIAAYYKRNREAEREYLAHARAETGRGVTPEQWARQIADRMTIRDQTKTLADNLEEARKLAYRETLFSIGKWWVHSRKLEAIPQYRRICLLPYVAAIVRASKLAALEYFLQRNPYCRFWTFTSGVRCGLGTLRAQCAYLHRRLSRLSAYLRERYGVELVFRSTEFGSLEFDEHGNKLAEKRSGHIDRDENGEPLFHVHAHVVVHSLVGYIKPAKWSEMISAVHDFWLHHWQADGVIRDARECCKYVTKPGDLLSLTPEQLGKLHEAIFRMKLCQPMGTLAKEIRDRKNNPAGRKVLRRYRTKRGGYEWREVFDQNEHAPMSDEERAAADAIADAEIFAHECALASRADLPERPEPAEMVMHPVSLSWERGETEFWAGSEVRTAEKTADFCRVMARLSPSIGPSGRKEPAVMVGFTRFDQRATEDHPLVSRLWAQTVQMWEEAAGDHAGLATQSGKSPQRSEDDARSAPIRVHTDTPTVPDEDDYSPGYSPPGDEDARLKVFLAQFDTPQTPEISLGTN